jgi:hypothetical protein
LSSSWFSWLRPERVCCAVSSVLHEIKSDQAAISGARSMFAVRP